MKYSNDAEQLRYRVLSSVAHLSYDSQLSEHLGDILCEIIPSPWPAFRCCIYHGREVVRKRVSAACGEDLPRQEDKAVMDVLPAACEGCPINRFNVTNNCQKCLAKECVAAYPFGTVNVTRRGAYIDPAKCEECGRYAAACLYNAISDTMHPCLRSCPVNAITMDKYRLAVIDYSRCISYGACMADCPFGAITDRSSIVSVIREIQSGEKVCAVFTPAIEGRLGITNVSQLKEGLRRLGFANAVEVSLSADTTAYHEARELREVVVEDKKITTSCCPASVDMIEKCFPELEPDISHTTSPMTLIVRYLKENEPDMKVVFFDPCMAKKLEIQRAENTADYVMAFEELAAIFNVKEIGIETLEVENVQNGSIKGKNLAVSGGVTAAVEATLIEDDSDQPISCVKCSNAKKRKGQLMVMNAGRMQENLIEGMACEGGCATGPDGVEPVQKLMKNRQKPLAAADKRDIKENLGQIHDLTYVHIEQRT